MSFFKWGKGFPSSYARKAQFTNVHFFGTEGIRTSPIRKKIIITKTISNKPISTNNTIRNSVSRLQSK